MTLILSFDVTTPRGSFCLFAWNDRELANSLLTLYVTGLKVVSNPGPFNQGSSDLTTRPSPPQPLLREGVDQVLSATTFWSVSYSLQYVSTRFCLFHE